MGFPKEEDIKEVHNLMTGVWFYTQDTRKIERWRRLFVMKNGDRITIGHHVMSYYLYKQIEEEEKNGQSIHKCK